MSTTTSAEAWLARPAPNPQARLRLFCFPYAGGGAAIFRTWAADLAQEVEVCALRLPGRENRLREAPFIRLTPMVDALVQALQPYLDRPFAFFGHSMGALVCFELAQALRQGQYQCPVQLFLSGRRAPQVPAPSPPIHALPEAQFVEQLRRLNGTPEAVLREPQLMAVLLPVLRADLAVCETYAHASKAPLDCPIAAFGGLEDGEAGYHDLAAWREHTRGTFSLQMFPGDHFFLHSSRMLLLQAIRDECTRWLGR